MAHDVSFIVPERKLGTGDVEFNVSQDGSKLGTLKISNGSVVWFPNGTTYGCKMAWSRFDKVMQENSAQTEKR